jgi:hypothetical protein
MDYIAPYYEYALGGSRDQRYIPIWLYHRVRASFYYTPWLRITAKQSQLHAAATRLALYTS